MSCSPVHTCTADNKTVPLFLFRRYSWLNGGYKQDMAERVGGFRIHHTIFIVECWVLFAAADVSARMTEP